MNIAKKRLIPLACAVAGGGRGLEGCPDLRLGIAIGSGHFRGCTVGAGDELEDIGFGAVGMRRNLRTQVFLCVIQRILDEGCILARECAAQLLQVVIDRAGGRWHS